MKLINANDVYYDNDFEKWYFEDDEDFENAQVVDDNYVKENQELKKQLAEKDKEIEDYKKALRGEMFINFKLPMEHTQFKRQLAEKDKEIKKHIDAQRQAIRKQICDKIREKVDNILWDDAETVYNEINDFLDQIEKGE